MQESTDYFSMSVYAVFLETKRSKCFSHHCSPHSKDAKNRGRWQCYNLINTPTGQANTQTNFTETFLWVKSWASIYTRGCFRGRVKQNFTASIANQFSTYQNFRSVWSSEWCSKSGLSVSCIRFFIECDRARAKRLEPNLSPDRY